MQRCYTNIEDIKKNSFLYIEYSTFAHVQRISFFIFCLLISIFLSIFIPCKAYQVVIGTYIPHLFYNPVLIAPLSIPVSIALIPALIRVIFLIGDIYFCENGIYIKRILLFDKLKISEYKHAIIQHNHRKKTISLLINRDGPLYKAEHSLNWFLFLLRAVKAGIWSAYYFRIMKENKINYNIYPCNSNIYDVIRLLKDRNMDIVDWKY